MMDFLKAEIERKKRQLAESSILAPNKKYFKRGDLAAKQAEEYWRKHSQLVEQNEEDKKNEHEVPEKLDANKEEEGQRKEKEKHASLPRKEVIRRLRERGEPIRLFGETDYEAFERLKKLEAQEPDVKEDEGLGNDFQMALEKVDQDYLNELIRDSGGASSGGSSSNDVSIKDDGTTLEDIKEMRNILGKESSDKDQEIILRFLKYILKQWGIALNKKDEEEKRNMKGKMERAMHAQTVSYMKPLFRKLKDKTMQEDILECLVSIVGFLLERDYIKANDAYLEMAIGNAPWPIGVTMVGIHARTGREKISSRYVAHVLNDETQRKYIQEMRNILGKESSDKDQEIILRFLKYILKQWGIALNKKDEEEKRNMKGKMERAMHAQTVSYMKPLFRKLKHKTMQEDILECLVSIVGFLLERDYIKANDAYLEMAIGNAPWPIGVTMVGIHARTGREKISSRYVAHVLNDETQRKYIQGLKRLMTQCQKVFPTDPSRSVNFEPIHH